MDISRLKDYKAYLIDLDGTLYRGQEAIPYAKEFVEWLRANHKKFMFVTNNSSRRPEEVAEHLCRFGINASTENVITSAQTTAAYIQEQSKAPKARVMIIGEAGLRHALEAIGCDVIDAKANFDSHVDYVVVGIDRSFNYEKLRAASEAIKKGAIYIGTNPDKRLPTEAGLFPGAGSLAISVATASGVEPIWMGKPERKMIDLSLERLAVTSANAIIVGDNLETDIAAAANAGIDSVLVLTGFSKNEDIQSVERKPTYTIKNLSIFLEFCN